MEKVNNVFERYSMANKNNQVIFEQNNPENHTHFYKYRSINEENCERTKDIFVNNKLFFSSPKRFNRLSILEAPDAESEEVVKVVCPQCNRAYLVRSNKILPGKRVVAKCKSCGGKIVIETGTR